MKRGEIEIGDIKRLLELPKRITLISHKNPDGDALGSSLALSRLLQGIGHITTVIYPTDFPSIFNYMEDIDKALISVTQHEEAVAAINSAEMIFLLDFNGLDRIDDVALEVQQSEATKVLIDHHLDPEPIADWMLSDTSASSTSELVFLFIDMLGYTDRIDKVVAEDLFTGILTDTGSFRYSTSSRVFQVAAALKERGVDDYFLQNRLFYSMTEKQLRLLGHCIDNRMELLPELKTGIIYLSADDYKDFKIQRGDTEGIVNYILMLRNMRVAIFITEQNGMIKLSFRSKGNISVQDLARRYFNGGGHRNASGGMSTRTLEETISYVKEILPGYLAEQGLKLDVPG